MRIAYNNKQYELVELNDIHNTSSYDIVAIFEVQYTYYQGGEKHLVSEEDFLAQDDNENSPIINEELVFIQYFYGASESKEQIIENAHYFLDHEYDKDYNELKYLLRKLKNAIVEFNKDIENHHSTKGSLDRLEYAQSDIYDWVNKNIEPKGEEDFDENCWELDDLIEEMNQEGIDLDSQAQIREYLEDHNYSKDHQIKVVKAMGFTPFEEEGE